MADRSACFRVDAVVLLVRARGVSRARTVSPSRVPHNFWITPRPPLPARRASVLPFHRVNLQTSGEHPSMAVIEERRIHLYSSSQSILLVGEGDFSFSSDLATAFQSAPNVVATSLDSRDEVKKKYPFATKALKNLSQLGASILHGLDATKMKTGGVLGKRTFDRIIFNFPHAGMMLSGGETNPLVVRENSSLMQKFFQNAGNRLTPGGQIHVNHKHVFPYTRWSLEQHAAACGLVLLRKEAFNLASLRLELPTYCNRRGYGRRPNRTFPVKCDTFTFIFIKRTHQSGSCS